MMKDVFYDEKEVKLRINNNTYTTKLVLRKINDNCFLKFTCDSKDVSTNGSDFFECLSNIKKNHPDIIILCKGYKYNVYPSRMAKQMGMGLKAYEMKLGKTASLSDLVDIFDCENEGLTSDIQEQELFYKKWLSSLLNYEVKR